MRLNVNVHASTLGADPEFVSFLADAAEGASIDLDRLTVEIVEHAPFWDGAVFHDSLRGLRDLGIGIALDDVGCGQSNYRMVVECRPDQFKIDRFFVHGAGHDHYRAVVLESIHSLAEHLGGHAVAEGVEDATDLETVTKIGIRHVAGAFLLAGPAPSPRPRERASWSVGANRRWHKSPDRGPPGSRPGSAMPGTATIWPRNGANCER